jgi:hypothetical protein
MPAITELFLEGRILSAETAQDQAVIELFLAADEATKVQALANFFRAQGAETELEAVQTHLNLP